MPTNETPSSPSSSPAEPNLHSGCVSLRDYFDARFASVFSMLTERDRRYTEVDRRYSEVSAGRAEALRIKEDGDRRALELAREIQTFKDLQLNHLREQLYQERGLYATKADVVSAVEKIDATLGPIVSYVASQQGRSGGITSGREWVGWLISVILGLAAVFAWVSR